MDLKLTDTERLILVNQYEILSRLDKDASDFYKQLSKQLYDGHEWLYQQSFQHLSPVMPEADAQLVLTILSMFDKLQMSYKALADKDGMEADELRFPGFDGNDPYEAGLMGFAHALAEDRRYVDVLNGGRDLNSHYQALPGYKAMLQRWVGMGSPYPMDIDQIRAIVPVLRDY